MFKKTMLFMLATMRLFICTAQAAQAGAINITQVEADGFWDSKNNKGAKTSRIKLILTPSFPLMQNDIKLPRPMLVQ